MNFRRKAWGSLLGAWIILGCMAWVFLSLGDALGASKDRDTMNAILHAMLWGGVAVMAWASLCFNRRIFQALAMEKVLHRGYPWKSPPSQQLRLLEPLHILVEQFPTITPMYIQAVLQSLHRRFHQHLGLVKRAPYTALCLPLMCALGLFIIPSLPMVDVHVIANLEAFNSPLVAPILLGIPGLLFMVLKLGYHQLRRIYDALFGSLEAWAWRNLPCPMEENQEFTGDFLKNLLSQWVIGVEKSSQVQNQLEKRHERFQEVLITFGERSQKLADLMKNQHAMLYKWVDEQIQSRHSMEKIAHRLQEGLAGTDESVKDALQTLVRLCQTMSANLERGNNTTLWADALRRELQSFAQVLGPNKNIYK